MFTRERLRRVALVWVVCLVAVSLQPYRPERERQSTVHRAAHLSTFAATGLMLLALSRERRQKAMAVLAVLCLAVFIETSQHLIYGNTFEWWDVRDDTIGLLIAVLPARRTNVRRLLLSD